MCFSICSEPSPSSPATTIYLPLVIPSGFPFIAQTPREDDDSDSDVVSDSVHDLPEREYLNTYRRFVRYAVREQGRAIEDYQFYLLEDLVSELTTPHPQADLAYFTVGMLEPLLEQQLLVLISMKLEGEVDLELIRWQQQLLHPREVGI